MPKKESSNTHRHLALLFPALTALAPFALRLWRFTTCGASCGADSLLGLFSDALAGCTFLLLTLACPRALRWIPIFIWTLFQVGSQELFHALQRYPVWQDLHYLFDADFVRNSTGGNGLSAPIFTSIIFLTSIASIAIHLPKIKLRGLVLSLPILVTLFFAHSRLEIGSAHPVTANRNPLHNFVIDATQNNKNGNSPATLTLPESLQHADISGASFLENTRGKAKNVLIVVMEGIPGLYIPEIRAAMGVPEYPTTMGKLAEITKDAMIIPDFVVHSHQTIRGLYAMLCGEFSKLSFGMPKAFEILNNPERAAACLPTQLREHGWVTHYLQGATLGFMSKDRFMAQAGFSEVHGVEWFAENRLENPFPFKWGAVDPTFFQGAYRYVSELQKSERPWMLTLLTVGTHYPYGVPSAVAAQYSSPRDAAIAALDSAVADFLHKLKVDGVLDDTLVIITSDESHGAPSINWASSWGIHIVLAPEQATLPHIKRGEYGLVDVESSILDYFGIPIPQKVIGRSYFRDYQSPREMFSFTNMVLRRHSGNISIKCTGGNICISEHAASLLAQPSKDTQEINQNISSETHAIASSLNNSLRSISNVQQISFASGELLQLNQFGKGSAINDIVPINIPAGSDVTARLKMTLLEGPESGVPFSLQAKNNRHKFNVLFESPDLPKLPELPVLHPGESIEQTFSFHNEHTFNRFTFELQAGGESGLLRIDKFDVTIKSNSPDAGLDTAEIDEFSPLEEAVQLSSTERVRTLIKQGTDINAANKSGVTALMYASMLGFEDVVTELLRHGAEINAVNKNGETALSLAMIAGSGHMGIAKALLASGADPSAALLPALWKGNQVAAQFLLDNGADLNQIGGVKVQWPPLLHVAYNGHQDLVTFLLDKGANINAASNKGETALYEALNNRQTDIAKILLTRGADPNASLLPAAWWGKTDIAKFLLEHGANINHKGGMGETKWTPLMHAAYHGRTDTARLLLEKGANVNVMDDKMETALSIALRRKHTDIAELLIAKGANANLAFKLLAIESMLKPAKIGENQTLLMRAAYHGRKDLVSFILGEGADINALTNKNESALSIALKRGHTDIVKMLLDRGANFNAMNNGMEGALAIALKKNHTDIAELLIARGANANSALKLIAIQSMLKPAKIGKNQTPLMRAAYHGRKDLVPFLLNKDTDVNALTNTMESALSVALKRGHADIAEMLLARGADANVALLPAAWQGRVASVQFLLEHGADINHVGGIGVKWTPLMHAVYHNRKELVELLLENGANVNAVADGMETALSIALGKQRKDIAKILLDKGANPSLALMPISWTGNLDAAIFLLEHGADVNYAGGIGAVWTPLMHAAYHGHKALTIFLLDEGANVNARDAAGITALQLANDRGNDHIASILKAAGGV